jgi:hypothetical protein
MIQLTDLQLKGNILKLSGDRYSYMFPGTKEAESYPKIIVFSSILMGHAVALLVEALCCKQEGRGFESR